jgi:hypothetical protein
VKQLLNNRPVCMLLVLQAFLYISFLAVDLFFPRWSILSGYMKYAGILLCVLIALLLHRRSWNRKDSTLLISALGFTAAADLFLLLLYLPVPGLLAFFAVHLIYIRRLRPSLLKPAAAVVLIAAAGCAAAYRLVPGFPVEFVLAGLYAALILAVASSSVKAALPRINRRLVVAGMALFLLCDIHVALFNTLAPGSPYYLFSAFLMWFFYLPAQALLALSGHDYAVQ